MKLNLCVDLEVIDDNNKINVLKNGKCDTLVDWDTCQEKRRSFKLSLVKERFFCLRNIFVRPIERQALLNIASGRASKKLANIVIRIVKSKSIFARTQQQILLL